MKIELKPVVIDELTFNEALWYWQGVMDERNGMSKIEILNRVENKFEEAE